MSLERKDAINLARVLAARLGAEPEKWGKAIEQASRAPSANPCGANYGSLPHGAASSAMSFMHEAVNETSIHLISPIKAIERETGETSRRNRDMVLGCVETHQFDPIKCQYIHEFSECHPLPCPGMYPCMLSFTCNNTSTFICDSMRFEGCQPPESFDCHSRFAYGPRPGEGTCNENAHRCPNSSASAFTCPANFSCRDNFYCNGTQTIPSFVCSDSYDCTVSFSCSAPNERAFGCSGVEQAYNCEDHFVCQNPFTCRSHDCGTSNDNDADTFNCLGHDCTHGFDCQDYHQCNLSPAAFICSTSFTCGEHNGGGDNVNGFACHNSPPSDFTCPSHFNCPGIYDCVDTHSCASQYVCPSISGFRCVKISGSVFDCSSYQCAGPLDFKCEGIAQFACNRGESSFVCDGGHVFRCIQNFSCDSHTCSAGGVPCDEIHNFSGQGGPGVFSCDSAFTLCANQVDCPEGSKFRCISDPPFSCGGPPPYSCSENFDICIPKHGYSDYGYCQTIPPGASNIHGCPNFGEYACSPIDQGGQYDCPATYKQKCEGDKVFDLASDP
jgi:hypothetical protein